MRPGAYPVWLFMSGWLAFAGSLVGTVFAVYFVTQVGLNPLQLILVGTFMELTVFVFEIPTGAFADAYGRRLSVIVGFVLEGAGFAFAGAVPQFWAVVAGWCVWGVGATFESGALEAWIADELGGRSLDRVFLRGSQIGSAFGLLGIGASVALASLHLQLPMILGGALIAALGLVLAFVMPERGFRPAPRESRSSWRTLAGNVSSGARVVRASPLLLAVLGIAAFWGASTEGLDRLWEAHFLRDVHLPALGDLKPVVWFGIVNAVALLLGVVVNGVFARIAARRQLASARTLLAVDTVIALALLAFALAGSLALALAAYWVYRLGRGLDRPLFTAWVNEHTESAQRATVLSIVNQGDAVGQWTGGPGIGVLGTLVSLRAALVAAGAALLPALGLYAREVRRSAAPQGADSAAPSSGRAGSARASV